LIQKLNDVSAAVEMRQGPQEVVRTLGFLSEYADLHFATEDKHMVRTAYPALEDHREKHREFRANLALLEQDFQEEGATDALAESINTLLGNWLVNHIETLDQKFGQFLTARDIDPSEQ
jgi:hemerythrin